MHTYIHTCMHTNIRHMNTGQEGLPTVRSVCSQQSATLKAEVEVSFHC
jgi:hypothetical protein